MNTILGPPAAAWLATPSGATYDALAAAASSMLESGRPLPNRAAKSYLPFLITYPGTDNQVIVVLDALPLNVPLPFMLETGSYLVNTEVPPGTYRAQNVENCYWETLDAAGEINDNNFVSAAPQVLMIVLPSDYAVNNDCEQMVKVG